MATYQEAVERLVSALIEAKKGSIACCVFRHRKSGKWYQLELREIENPANKIGADGLSIN